jgi:hypothetical protein
MLRTNPRTEIFCLRLTLYKILISANIMEICSSINFYYIITADYEMYAYPNCSLIFYLLCFVDFPFPNANFHVVL